MASKPYYHYRNMKYARLLILGGGCLLLVCLVVVPTMLKQNHWPLAAFLLVISGGVFLGGMTHIDDAAFIFWFWLTRQYRAVCRRNGLTDKQTNGQLVYPRLCNFEGSPDAWSAVVVPLAGQSLADWERAADAFRLAFKTTGLRVRDNGDGTLTLAAGYQPLAAHELVPEAVATEPPELVDGVTWRQLLKSVTVGHTEDGGVYCMPFLDTHSLVVGVTGAGKGSVIWSLILGLSGPIRAGVVRPWAVDPKRLEMRIGEPLFGGRYACTEAQIVELLEEAVRQMHERADELAGKTRKFEPSLLHPVNLIILDELGYLSSLITDRKTSQRVDNAIRTLLILGRALGFVVVGAVQDPRKDNIDMRDLFPIKVAMRLEKPMVDLVLGAGSYEAGAQCNLIPLGAEGAGVAFVKQEGVELPLCVRFSWCSDELIIKTAAALAPVEPTPKIAS